MSLMAYANEATVFNIRVWVAWITYPILKPKQTTSLNIVIYCPITVILSCA